MNDLLDLPPIEAAALDGPKTDLQPLDLRRIDLTDVALAQYGDWRKDVAATKTNLSTLALDLSTAAKCKEARSLRQRLIGEPLATVRKVAAGIKSKMATTSKAVGAELERIEAAYTEADALILPKIEAREAELEAERLEKARLEAERVAKLEAGIATIRSYVQKAAGLPAERIAKGVAQLEGMTFPPETWQEFAAQATAARDESLAALRLMHAAAVQAEADRAERERLEAETARLRAEAAKAEAERQAERDTEAARIAAECAAEEARERDRLEKVALAQAAMPPAAQNTVTTPDGTVADAGTGEILSTPEPALYRPLQDVPAAPILKDLQDEGPTIKLGDLCDRLSGAVPGGFKLTEAMVVSLGITPVSSKGRAVLVAESALPALREALIARVREVLA